VRSVQESRREALVYYRAGSYHLLEIIILVVSRVDPVHYFLLLYVKLEIKVFVLFLDDWHLV